MVLSKLKDYGNLVMFSHSIFSLPFGLVSMIFAYGGIPPINVFIRILIALLAARNGANAFNRVADREIDKKNPRTKDRSIPTGQVKNREAVALTIFCFIVFAAAAYELNFICFLLTPVAIALFILYSYSKRFTWLCHYILGVACGSAAVGAWLAIRGIPTLEMETLIPFFLGGAVCFWIAGFDIIYATQDIDFDRKEGIFSIPSRFGLRNSLIIAKISHVISVCLLACLPLFIDLGFLYYMGLVLILVLLMIEHYNVNPQNIKKMKIVSYSINQVISIVFLFFTLGDFFL